MAVANAQPDRTWERDAGHSSGHSRLRPDRSQAPGARATGHVLAAAWSLLMARSPTCPWQGVPSAPELWGVPWGARPTSSQTRQSVQVAPLPRATAALLVGQGARSAGARVHAPGSPRDPTVPGTMPRSREGLSEGPTAQCLGPRQRGSDVPQSVQPCPLFWNLLAPRRRAPQLLWLTWAPSLSGGRWSSLPGLSVRQDGGGGGHCTSHQPQCRRPLPLSSLPDHSTPETSLPALAGQ